MSNVTLIAVAPYILMLVSGLVFWWLSSRRPHQTTLGKLYLLQAARVGALVLFVIGLFAVLAIISNFGFVLIWLVAAVVLSALIVIEDGLDPAVRDRLPLPGFWDTAFEEIGELVAQLCFALSFLTVFRERADAVAGQDRPAD